MGRAQSMTSSVALQTFQTPPPVSHPARPQSQHQSKATVRMVDKPKGTPRALTKAVDEDDDDAWAEMKKKRDEKKKFRFGKKDKKEENSLNALYHDLD